MSWFKKKNVTNKKEREPVDRPVAWPNGIAVKVGDTYWYIKGNTRLHIISERAVRSWGLHISNGTNASTAAFRKAGTLGFRDGSLIKDISSGKIYLIAASKKRHVTNPDVLTILGYPVVDVSREEAAIHINGEDLNAI